MPDYQPNVNGLAGIMSLPGPVYQQAMQQWQQGQQQQRQDLMNSQQDFRAKQLANMFAEQNNPQLVTAQQLANTGKDMANQDTAISLNQRKVLAPEELAAKRAEFMSKKSTDELKDFYNRAEKLMQSDDPGEAQRGQKMLMASKEEFDRRRKQENLMQITNAEIQGRKDVANIGAGATLGAARIGADSRVEAAKARAGAVGDLQSMVMSGKVPPEKAIVAYQAQAQQALAAGDTETYSRAMQNLQELTKFVMNKPVAGQANSINVGQATGMPTNGTPASPFGGGAPAAPVAQQPKAAAIKAPPGRVVIYKNGKPVGSVPAAQAQDAQAQGYTLQ